MDWWRTCSLREKKCLRLLIKDRLIYLIPILGLRILSTRVCIRELGLLPGHVTKIGNLYSNRNLLLMHHKI